MIDKVKVGTLGDTGDRGDGRSGISPASGRVQTSGSLRVGCVTPTRPAAVLDATPPFISLRFVRTGVTDKFILCGFG